MWDHMSTSMDGLRISQLLTLDTRPPYDVDPNLHFLSPSAVHHPLSPLPLFAYTIFHASYQISLPNLMQPMSHSPYSNSITRVHNLGRGEHRLQNLKIRFSYIFFSVEIDR